MEALSDLEYHHPGSDHTFQTPTPLTRYPQVSTRVENEVEHDAESAEMQQSSPDSRDVVRVQH
jgi:hypothetical protein